mmetsp:Transcript_2006/g.2776  ORF Transcript_2006/g.2776 Transcript_2006/m.2776 type:complete len:240 (+) Transcript_2006:64-783(+)
MPCDVSNVRRALYSCHVNTAATALIDTVSALHIKLRMRKKMMIDEIDIVGLSPVAMGSYPSEHVISSSAPGATVQSDLPALEPALVHGAVLHLVSTSSSSSSSSLSSEHIFSSEFEYLHAVLQSGVSENWPVGQHTYSTNSTSYLLPTEAIAATTTMQAINPSPAAPQLIYATLCLLLGASHMSQQLQGLYIQPPNNAAVPTNNPKIALPHATYPESAFGIKEANPPRRLTTPNTICVT